MRCRGVVLMRYYLWKQIEKLVAGNIAENGELFRDGVLGLLSNIAEIEKWLNYRKGNDICKSRTIAQC